MRLNQYIARNEGISRRAADKLIADGRIKINDLYAIHGQRVSSEDKVTLDGRIIAHSTKIKTILFNKPVGYVCSRAGQGSKTIYDLLPKELHNLNSVGRLDKDSSGLLLMTNDGELANRLTHPRYEKQKTYEVELNRELGKTDFEKIKLGIELEDGVSKLDFIDKISDKNYKIIIHEGRNRQIRRTFAALDHEVKRLHRVGFGQYKIRGLDSGKFRAIEDA